MSIADGFKFGFGLMAGFICMMFLLLILAKLAKRNKKIPKKYFERYLKKVISREDYIEAEIIQKILSDYDNYPKEAKAYKLVSTETFIEAGKAFKIKTKKKLVKR